METRQELIGSNTQQYDITSKYQWMSKYVIYKEIVETEQFL